MKVFALLLCVAVIPGFISCTEGTFDLLGANAVINLYNDVASNTVHEFISIWLTFSNGVVIGDIATVYIVHDDSELHWELTPEYWRSLGADSNQILLSRLRMHDFTPLPRGRYRAVVQNYGGEERGLPFFVSPRLVLPRENLPLVSTSSPRALRSSFNLNYAFGIDQDGQPYSIRKVQEELLLTPDIEQSYDASGVYMYAPSERQGGYLSGPH